MSNTISAVLRLKESVGTGCPTKCDGYIVHHRGYEVVLSFPRTENGVNDQQIIDKIRSLAIIYHDQYGSTERGNFIDLFDDLTDYNYWITMNDNNNNNSALSEAEIDGTSLEDPEEMMDYLEQQQDEEDMEQQQQQEDQLDILKYVEQMETLYGANIEAEKDWNIRDQIKSAFPYETTIHAVKSALDFMMVTYHFDPETNIFTVYMLQKDKDLNIYRVNKHIYYEIIVRYATPFYAVVRFRLFNIPECDMVHYNTQLTVVKQKVTFQYNGDIRI